MPKLICKLLALTAIALSLICAAAAFFGVDALTLAYRILSPLLSPTGSFCALVMLLLGVVGAYFQFKPKLSLEPQVPLKSDSVLDTPFRVTNESFLPIHNLKQEWLIERSRTFLPQGYFNEVEEIDTHVQTIRILGPGQSTTLYPLENVRLGTQRVTRLALMVTIGYQTAILRLKRRQYFRFEGSMAADESFHWYSRND